MLIYNTLDTNTKTVLLDDTDLHTAYYRHLHRDWETITIYIKY